MRFDWYEASLLGDPVRGLESIRTLGDSVHACDGLAKRYNYRQGFTVQHRELGTVATVLMGGNARKDGREHFHAWASSDNTDNFVSLVRDTWPGLHLVTRADPAEDFIEEGITKRMLPVMKRVAKKHRLKFARRMDMIDKTAGLTQYMGSDTSDYKVRGYEKGFEVVGKIDVLMGKCSIPKEGLRIINTMTGELIRPQDWFRLELQMRPREEGARELLSTLSPTDAWGCTAWTRDLALETMALDLQAVLMRSKKHSTLDEREGWMCMHYHSVFEQRVKEKGELEAMRHILSVIAKQKRFMLHRVT